MKAIKISDNPRGLLLEWSDGFQGVIPFTTLRQQCPCAICKGERLPFDPMGGIGGRAGSPSDQSEPSGLASGEQIVPKDLFKVGSYAIGLRWGDGHDTGIYSFDYLRQLVENTSPRVVHPRVIHPKENS
ncbi:MAG: DUF971 domain-containing protein [Deltaproteobacteria bacterium]|nr:DUF971 domain-containing protein [Deltaproteobacteria bacterium]